MASNVKIADPDHEKGFFSPALLTMYLDTLMMAIGFFMLVPILGIYFINELKMSAALSGSVLAVSGLTQNLFKFASGLLADRIGYKKAILLGVGIRIIGFSLYGFVSGPIGFAIAAFISGLGGAVFHPASYAAYAFLSNEEMKSRIYAIREMLSNVGFVVGPVIGVFLLKFDFKIVCITAAFMFVVAFIVTLILLPTMKGEDKRISFVNISKVILRDRSFLLFNIFMLGIWSLNVQLYLAVPVKAQNIVHEEHIAYLYTIGAAFMVVFQLPLIRILSDRFTNSRILVIGTVVLGIGLFTMGMAVNFWTLLLAVIIFTLGQMIAVPTMNNMVSGFADQSLFASYFGFSGIGLAIGGFLGNSGVGYLYDVSIEHSSLAWLPWSVQFLWAIVLVIPLLLIGSSFDKSKQ